jgi:RHS repeat-associated protein
MSDDEFEPRWVGSGWTVFNNKGKPVRQYEPFFSDTHDFEFGVEVGVSPVLFYDPVERVVATLHPNHTWEKVVFDPWRQEIWDVNDTLLLDPKQDDDVKSFFLRLPDTEYLPTWYAQRAGGGLGAQEQNAANKTVVHAATPSIAHADSLGRTFLTIAHNKFERNNVMHEESYATRVQFDIEGNQRAVIDAKDRIVMRYDYDMLGTRIHQASMEAGERWMLNDVTGKPIYAWDSRNHRIHATYDPLRRPTDSFLSESNSPEILIGRTEYGESQLHPETKNQCGKIVKLFDQAGIVSTEDYDFKGNLLTSRRQFAREYKATLDWSASLMLETEVFAGSTTYDALNRPVSSTSPDGSVYRPTFNEATLLETVSVNLRGALTPMPFVTNIDYDAKGRRVLIEYGNNVRTEHRYDPLTFRLSNLKTTRLSDQALMEDLSYTYDPAGNITRIQDDAQQTIYFNNQVATPSNDYTYDAIYRLINAEGREHIGQAAHPETTWNDQFRVHLPHPGDGQAMRRYSERYEYDPVGNFERMIHQATNGDWTRAYAYNEVSLLEPGKQSNRLSSTTVGVNNPELYPYDAHGNMIAMPHLPAMRWDYRDQLERVDLGGGGTAYYVYDVGGQQVRKVVEKNGGMLIEERIYLGGFEIFRRRNGSGTLTLERETLHVMDDKQRIALVETCTQSNDGSPAQLIRYQFSNHLGSALLELDDAAQIISYEEYSPYGSTSYQAQRSGLERNPKRYRYTGMERDEESGLNYHGARYYAPWIGTWLSTDPAGIVDHINMYIFSRNNPINFNDRSGRNSNKVSEAENALINERTRLDDLVENKLPETLSAQRQLEVELKSTEESIKQLESDIKKLNPNEAGFAARKQELEAELLRNQGHYGVTRSDLEIAGERVQQVEVDIKKSESTVKTLARRVTKLGGDPNVERGDVRYGKADPASLAETEVDDLEKKFEELEGKKKPTGGGGSGGTRKKSGPTKRWWGRGGGAPGAGGGGTASPTSVPIDFSLQREVPEGLGPRKSWTENEIENFEQWGFDTLRGLSTGGPAGAVKALFGDPTRLPVAASTVMVSPHMFGARGGIQSLAAECMNPANCMKRDWRYYMIDTINIGRELQGKKPITWGQLTSGNY